MNARNLMGLVVGFAVLGGCASAPTTPDDEVQFMASDKARQLIEEQGKATATMLGYADDTDLICERFNKTGSHIVTKFCYTRGERERRLLNHQEEWRHFTKGGPCQMNNSCGNGGL